MEVKIFHLNTGMAESLPETSVGTCFRLIMALISNNIITSKYTS